MLYDNFARELRFSPIENVVFFFWYRHHKRIKGTKQQSCLEGFICSVCLVVLFPLFSNLYLGDYRRSQITC